MQCQSCSSLVPDNAKFCTECGAALSRDLEVQEPREVLEAQEVEEAQEAQEPQEVQEVQDPEVQDVEEVQESQETEEVPEVESFAQPQQPASETEDASVLVAQPQDPFSGAAEEPVFDAQPQDPFSANSQSETQQPFGANPQPGNQADFQPAPQQPVYAQGCIAAAWQDVKNSPGWFGRMALLGIIQCVPILSFFAAGYALNWAREVPFGGKTVLPQRIFTSSNFEMGFYSFLITLVFSLVGGLCASILGFIPLIGGLVGVALSAGLMAVAYLCCVRVGIKQRLGEGFKLVEIWESIKRNPSSFLAAALVPIVVSCVMVAVIASVGTVLGMGAAIPFMFFGDVAFVIFGLLAFVACLIVYVVCCVVIAAATLITDRALAHWVGRYAPEWIA